jgi:hypothetical protein
MPGLDRLDRLGRRRVAGQGRGLRPLFPLLPRAWVSRALRVAMPEWAWADLDARATQAQRAGDTRARALGTVLLDLLARSASRAPAGSGGDWLDWERGKAQRLLGAVGRAA